MSISAGRITGCPFCEGGRPTPGMAKCSRHSYAEAVVEAYWPTPKTVDIVFDGPPGPESGRFVEVEDMDGKGVRIGEWIDRDNGFWALRVAVTP